MGDEEKQDEDFKALWGAKVSTGTDVDENVLRTCIEFLKPKLEENIDPKVLRDHLIELKSILDEGHGYPWTVVAGKNYGTHVVAEKGTFGFFYLGKHAITIFKVSSQQPAFDGPAWYQHVHLRNTHPAGCPQHLADRYLERKTGSLFFVSSSVCIDPDSGILSRRCWPLEHDAVDEAVVCAATAITAFTVAAATAAAAAVT